MTGSLSKHLNDYACDRRDHPTDQLTLFHAFQDFLENDFGPEYDLHFTAKKEADDTHTIDVQFYGDREKQLRFRFGRASFSVEAISLSGGHGMNYNRDVVHTLQSTFLVTELSDNKCKAVYEYRNAANGTNFPDNVLERFGKFMIDCMDRKEILMKVIPRPKPRKNGLELG